MESIIENLGALERRFDITISIEQLQGEAENRLKKISKDKQIAWFSSRKGSIQIDRTDVWYTSSE